MIKKRGEIWWVNFDPSVGQEVKKKRPAVIISNNTSNKYLKRYQVIPLSSQVDKIYPSQTLIQVKGKPSKAMADQLTTVNELRLMNKVGHVSDQELKQIIEIIKIQLGINS